MESYERFAEELEGRGVDLAAVRHRIKRFQIVQANWTFMNSGTRFNLFPTVGAARNVFEAIDDAALVHKLCGVCGSMGIETPAGGVKDYGGLRTYADQTGISFASVEPNLTAEYAYRHGSLCNSDAAVRESAVCWVKENIALAGALGAKVIVNWIGDGTNYPGQGDFRKRKRWLLESYSRIYDALPGDMRMLLEYKPFEPRFYHTDLMDWGMAHLNATKLGDKAQVIVDLGHHLHGANIEHIVSVLLDERKLGGFHFNGKKNADDDLLAGAINPYELYLIMREIANAEDDETVSDCAGNIMFMIDQNHFLEAKIPTVIKSVMNIQAAYAKALLVNGKALAAAQENNDVARCESIVYEAFAFDVRPLLRRVREEMGLAPDPLQEYYSSGYERKIAARG